MNALFAPIEAAAVGFAYLVHRLGAGGRSPRWRSRYVRWLIERHDFPEPLPSRALRVAELTWDRRAVDAWFDHRLPDAAAAAAEADERHAAAAVLDDRARAFACTRKETVQ